ncbi:MAG: hypothetical protein JKX85_11335 [Phycisphaeraceae bacterium]|nr:hypothetical protein [Phycisphaeraceae bacterium]
MKIPLQKIGHEDSRYERPNQKWVCGHTTDGRPCPLGPDAKGACTSAAQCSCEPLKEGDRWQCTRLGVYGGPCPNGPNPDGSCCHPQPEFNVCHPRLSGRTKRTRIVFACLAFTVGLLTVALNGPWTTAIISPGQLSHAHLAIEPINGQSSNCTVCHNASGVTQSGALGHLGIPDRLVQSENCLTCHFNQDRDSALRVHNVNIDQLASWGKRDNQTPQTASPTLALVAATAMPGIHTNIQNDIACATCHQEHRGKMHNLSQLSDTQCQVCHTTSFASFNDGHPAFDLVSHTRSGIAFDHQKPKHASRNCADCHMPDTAGISMRLKPYEQACMGCHNQGTEDWHGSSLKDNSHLVFQLPLLEVEDIYWPEDAAMGEDEIPPLMRLLLLGDDDALAALQSIDADADGIPAEWFPDEDESMSLFTKAVKHLLDDLAHGDEKTCRKRIAKALDVAPNHRRVTALAKPLAAANFAFLTYQQRWLPLLSDDLEGEEVKKNETQEPDWSYPDGHAGWYVDQDDIAVSYRPIGHADPVIKGLLDALVESESTGVNSAKAQTSDATATRAQQRSMILKQLTDSGGFARTACLTCHQMEAQSQAINWTASNRSQAVSGFSKFNHGPHMTMLRDSDNCTQCHKQPGPEDQTSAVLSRCQFLPHDKATCASCHTPTQADNSCLNCHVYHHQRP